MCKAARSFGIIVAVAAGSVTMASAQAQPASTTPAATNVGPGRITCHSGKSCELTIGTPISLRYKIDPAALAAPDKERLTKQCTAKATPCIATVTGTETPKVVKAASIKFYN